jgi:serine/threonine protein kinase/tetratricopeptide (TPR) repeat protein
VTDSGPGDTTDCDVHGLTTRTSSADSHDLKARLFGDEQGDRVHKQLLKAKLLRQLQSPTGGVDTHDEGEGSTEPIAQGLPDSPVRIGRYAVLRKLGQGGMGVVYVAFDEDLDRKVALKLLRGELSKDDRGRTRMLREAQALARLSHPNVVQVHEVGQWTDHDYVAMEYVDGLTLDRWLTAQPRTWREVLDVMLQAGRGLEAAHAANLVHRDFKPANLLVGRDGRARVLDFGLARAAAEGETMPSARVADVVATAEHTVGEDSGSRDDFASNTVASSAFDKLLTVTGAVLGTPAYMAPEQHLGQAASTLSDQFSFCVVLYEALYGERPFRGSNRTEYAIHVNEGKIEPPPHGSGVPAWLRRVVLRGLVPKPADRWSSMTELLSELGRDRTRTWRGAAVAAGFLLALGIPLSFGSSEAKLCEPDSSAIADSWGDERRDAVRTAFDKTDMPEAANVLEHTVRSLDAYAEQLVAARAEACEARWVERSQTDAQLELRVACLEQRERELGAVVEVLADADREVVLHAPELVAGLGDVGLCARVDLLEAGTPVPKDAEAVEAIAEVRRTIADAHAARDVGRLAEAKAMTASAWRSAKQIGFDPLLGELHNLDGRTARAERDYPEAWRHFVAAATIAQRNQHLELWTQAQLNLALLAARSHVNPDERLEFMYAAAAVEQLGAPARYAALLALARGLAHSGSGQPELALTEFARGLALADAGFIGSEHVTTNILVARSTVHASLGHVAHAREDLDRVLAMRSSHNRTQLDALFDLAVVEFENGELDAAERDFEDAMRGYEVLIGPDYASIGHGHLALADIALRRGQPEVAMQSIEAALTILDEQHEDHHWALDGLASVQLELGQHAAAEQTLRRAIAQRERTSSADATYLAYLHGRLGTVLRGRGQLDEALAEYDRAMTWLEQQEVDAPLVLAQVLLERGKTRLAQHQPQLALSSLERAVELAPVDCGDAWLAGHARLAMAESLEQLNIRLDDKRALASVAVELLRDLPSSAADLRRATELSESSTPANEIGRTPR